MKLELLDSISLPSDPGKANDDAFGLNQGAAVVFDGATGLGEPLMPGESDAAWLARFGSNRLLAHLKEGQAPRIALGHALADAEKSFVALRRRAPAATYEIPFASMMLIAVQREGVEALWFGDCAALMAQPGAPVMLLGDAIQKREAEAARVAQLATKHNLSPASGSNRPEYLSALRHARNFVNTDKGGWLFGPDVRALEHVSSTYQEIAKGTIVLLVTDGFLALASDYHRYDLDSLVGAAKSIGLKALGTELREIEANDSDGKLYPRFKTSDDATAVLLRVT